MTDSPPALDPEHVRDYVQRRGGRICDLPGDLLDRLAPHTHSLAATEIALINGARFQSLPCKHCPQKHWCLVNGCARTSLQPQSERV